MSDDQLVVGLRATAVRHGDGLAVGPVPWDAIRGRHRRTRARKAGLLAATAAALATALAIGPGNLLPARVDPGPAHGIEGPIGRLARDQAWVNGLKDRAEREWGRPPGRVPFADDIAGVRLALVELPRPERFADAPVWAWFAGPTGADPASMLPSETGDDRESPAAIVVTSTAGEGYATVVVVAKAGGRLSVWTHNDVDRAGQVVSAVALGREVGPGLYTARVKVPYPQVDVRLDGLGRDDWRGPVQDLALRGREVDTRPPQLSDAAWWAGAKAGARGDAAAPPPGLSVQQTYNALGLSGDVPGSRVLWVRAGSPLSQSVLALRAPSGGWVLVACATAPPGTDANGSTTVGAMVEAVATRPDGPAGGLALVWPFLRQPDPTRMPSRTGEYGLLGPASAVRAEVPTADGTMQVPLADGAAVTRFKPTGPVRFVGPAGVVATSPVAPVWDWQGDGVLAHQS